MNNTNKIMLHNTSGCASFKHTAVFILCMLCIVHAHHSIAQKFEKKGNRVTYRGNTFELSAPIYDTIDVVDPVTGKDVRRLTNKRTIPVTMNGRKIYRMYDLVVPPVAYSEFGPLGDYIFRELRDELNKLPNGNYTMLVDNIVIDDIGKIVYYEYHGISPDKPVKIPAVTEKAIIKKLDTLMYKAAPFRPGQVAMHQNATVRTDITFDMYIIQVHDHKTTIKKQ